MVLIWPIVCIDLLQQQHVLVCKDLLCVQNAKNIVSKRDSSVKCSIEFFVLFLYILQYWCIATLMHEKIKKNKWLLSIIHGIVSEWSHYCPARHDKHVYLNGCPKAKRGFILKMSTVRPQTHQNVCFYLIWHLIFHPSHFYWFVIIIIIIIILDSIYKELFLALKELYEWSNDLSVNKVTENI